LGCWEDFAYVTKGKGNKKQNRKMDCLKLKKGKRNNLWSKNAIHRMGEIFVNIYLIGINSLKTLITHTTQKPKKV
jgi:hypothetical protein